MTETPVIAGILAKTAHVRPAGYSDAAWLAAVAAAWRLNVVHRKPPWTADEEAVLRRLANSRQDQQKHAKDWQDAPGR